MKTDAHWGKQVSSDKQGTPATHEERGGERFVPDAEATAIEVDGPEVSRLFRQMLLGP